tara:strand:+ start:128 stop:1198 length:1071 start_codon:yes stop_codon:yes gene_type:complete
MHLGLARSSLEGHGDAEPLLLSMIKGIQDYQRSTYFPKVSHREVIWNCGQASLNEIKTESGIEKDDLRICILVPSLINAATILDLCEERSLSKWFSQKGYKTLLFDWGDLCKEPHEFSISDLVVQRLSAALSFARKSFPKAKIHLLGYCMGGAMALGALAMDDKLADTITLLATPWDYHKGREVMMNRVRFWAPSAMLSIQSNGYLSADALQSLFASLAPEMAQKKFSKFSNMDQSSEDAHLFIAVEDWLNENRDLPALIARECVWDWYIQNKPYLGQWKIYGKHVDLSQLKIPVLVFASDKDRLVEWESAIAVQEHLSQAEIMRVSCGHIGMIAGKDSVNHVWQPIEKWMKKHTN